MQSDLIDECYRGLVQSFHDRNFVRAAGYLHVIYLNIPFHISIMNQIKLEGLNPRQLSQFIETYIREFSDDPSGYLMAMSFQFGRGQLVGIRKVWRDTCANAVKGFHFQPAVIASLYDAEKGQPRTVLAGIGIASKYSEALSKLNTSSEYESLYTDGPASLPAVHTGAGEPIGTDGIALNGTLSGFTKPTEYFFRYGDAPDALTRQTEHRDMPAGLFGRVHDSGANVFHRITGYAASLEFGNTGTPMDGAAPAQLPTVSMKFQWPFGKDRNHLDGIGIIDLLAGWKTQAHMRSTVDGMDVPDTYPTPAYPGEGIDLRDAVLGISYRSQDLNAKGFVPVAWIHGRTGTAAEPSSFDDLAAWAVTAGGTPQTFTADGDWHRVEFALPGQSIAWTFCGSNMEEMGTGMARYTYAPIQRLQRDNMGGNICIAFVHGDDLDTPEGAIEIAELTLTYRSRSLLGPGQQAVLRGITGAQLCNPENLTDGSIGDLEKCWSAAVSLEKPGELIWQLRGTADLETLKIHQSVLAPAKDIEIAVSQDGTAFNDVWTGTMGDVPEDPASWGAFASTGALSQVVVLAGKTLARYIRLRVTSGYRNEQAGLDAFEVFGVGLPFMPSPENFTLSEGVEDLPVGETVFAQLVAENAEGVFEGEIVEINRPQSEVPHILSVLALADDNGAATISIRTIAMGTPATLVLTLESDLGDKITVPALSIGKWQVPRDTRVKVDGLKPGVCYQGMCRAENEAGQSAPLSFLCVADD